MYKRRWSVMILLFAFMHQAAGQECSDIKATPETRHLFRRLEELRQQYTIFGHQDALAYGVGWKGITGLNDVQAVAGDSPGLYGWDIGHLESGDSLNIDRVPFSRIKQYIREGYERGALITISWHLQNPLTSGSAWDTTHGTVKSVLPGGSRHQVFKTWLDKVAAFMHDLRDKRGRYIPVLFRPFHELTGNWFWWCRNTCTPDEYIALWRFTVAYLRGEKQLHHLLFVYNTAEFADEADFMARYPGDDMVDMVSLDMYQHGGIANKKYFIDEIRRQLEIVCAVAGKRQKLAALAETGMEAVPDKNWWTGTLEPSIAGFPLSYVLVWRNHGYMPSLKKMHYYAPYPGQVSADDFRKFTGQPRILLEKAVRQKRLYR